MVFYFSYKYLAVFSAAVLMMIHIAVILKRRINYNCLYTNRIWYWLPETNLTNIWLARLPRVSCFGYQSKLKCN